MLRRRELPPFLLLTVAAAAAASPLAAADARPVATAPRAFQPVTLASAGAERPMSDASVVAAIRGRSPRSALLAVVVAAIVVAAVAALMLSQSHS